ncbi:hypothetical protein BT96DRAFT_1080185 [Gymnopus androsaceus JB14]|uniref:Uncharacterized protein n=1 Tax=Gymnopus androsaceus JB14 TaxID=1447944 RepID=A0A6A4I0I5_9AGAR|nr:hypothetical protein BT96DRAFT_1080185 [Gymnopus androsaceus JB14]
MGFWDTITSPFTRDGAATCFCERFPILGYGVAGIQKLAGNDEHAKRALALTTNSTLTVAGGVGGFFVGGPVGAALGAAAASAGVLVWSTPSVRPSWTKKSKVTLVALAGRPWMKINFAFDAAHLVFYQTFYVIESQ